MAQRIDVSCFVLLFFLGGAEPHPQRQLLELGCDEWPFFKGGFAIHHLSRGLNS